MKNILINTVFKLLACASDDANIYRIKYLFGASTGGHEARKKRWERALVRLYKDKDMMDYLYYLSETDKENVFRRKVGYDIPRGARLRTLHLVYSARMAYINMRKGRHTDAKGQQQLNEEIKEVTGAYEKTVDTN